MRVDDNLLRQPLTGLIAAARRRIGLGNDLAVFIQ
jgi:hypothetical protein